MAVSRAAAVRFIVALGTISLLADITYEGARSVNGPFLGTLGAGAAVIGIVSGAGELAGYALRLLSGRAADRTQRYWALTVAGYILNLLAVPLMALARGWPTAAGLILLERAGKGVRTPARDVMLSQASESVGRGWGFGLHEFMDQTGAFLGPLIAAAVLARWNSYPRVYLVYAAPALLALVTLLIARRIYPDPSRFEEKQPVRQQQAGLPRAFWIYVAAAGLVAAGIVDFPLIAFHFQKTNLVTTAAIPLFYAGAMGIEAIAALIFGRLFDRVGTWALMAGVVLSAASTPLVFFGSFGAAVCGMLLWGAGMGAQQSSLRARIADLVARESRGTAYGIFNTVYGVLWFVGSAAIGMLYSWSLSTAVLLAVGAQAAALPLLAMVRKKS